MSNLDNWPEPSIAVDLDGTLAEYNGWQGKHHIGAPIPKMMARVKAWIAGGKTVKIFTARCYQPENVIYVKAWLRDQGLPDLEITNIKDPGMTEFWDDRAIGIEFNTGEIKSA